MAVERTRSETPTTVMGRSPVVTIAGIIDETATGQPPAVGQVLRAMATSANTDGEASATYQARPTWNLAKFDCSPGRAYF